MSEEQNDQSRSDQSGSSTADQRDGDRGGSKHTPGPWKAKRAEVMSDGAYDYGIHHEREIIAEVFGRTSITNYPPAEANAEFIVRACNSHDELVASVKELRDAVAAAMRVVADLDVAERLGWAAETRQQRFIDELKIVGIKDGFGKRADDLIKKIEGRS